MKQYLLTYIYRIMDGACEHHSIPASIALMAKDDSEVGVIANRIWNEILSEDNGYWIRTKSEFKNLRILNLTDGGEVAHQFPLEIRSLEKKAVA